MKQSIIPLLITGLLAIGAGVAIAGLPSTPPGDGLVITESPTTTTSTVPIIADTVAALPTTTTTTMATTTTVLQPTSTVNGRSLTPTTVSPPRPLAERGELAVVVANGADVAGLAGSTAASLELLGYNALEAVDAPAVVAESLVYHPDELAAEAIRLAADLGWDVDRVAPNSAGPELATTIVADLVAIIGLDQAGPLDGR